MFLKMTIKTLPKKFHFLHAIYFDNILFPFQQNTFEIGWDIYASISKYCK